MTDDDDEPEDEPDGVVHVSVAIHEALMVILAIAAANEREAIDAATRTDRG